MYDIADCNRCEPSIKCKGKADSLKCPHFQKPPEGWMLAEVALVHADSLNKALSALPFEVNLGFYLK